MQQSCGNSSTKCRDKNITIYPHFDLYLLFVVTAKVARRARCRDVPRVTVAESRWPFASSVPAWYNRCSQSARGVGVKVKLGRGSRLDAVITLYSDYKYSVQYLNNFHWTMNISTLLSTGEMISEKDRCKTCTGRKVNSETKILEVHVDKGMKEGQRIPFRGEGDQSVG